jgi:hypothetical protein
MQAYYYHCLLLSKTSKVSMLIYKYPFSEHDRHSANEPGWLLRKTMNYAMYRTSYNMNCATATKMIVQLQFKGGGCLTVDMSSSPPPPEPVELSWLETG